MSGIMAENATKHNDGNAVGSEEKENKGLTEVPRPECPRRTKPCNNIAVVRPSPRCVLCETNAPFNGPQSPGPSSFSSNTDNISSQKIRLGNQWNCTLQCPFSFDLRDSMRRVAREQRLEALRLMEEHRLTEFRFKANPVRRYKPLVLKQSARQLTVPRSPFTSGDPGK